MSLIVKSGTYTGNGTSQSINIGVDLTTNNVVLFVKGGANVMQVTTKEMGSDKTQNITGETPASGRITALGATGFSVGNHASVNTNAATYYYLAFQDSAGTDMKTFTYAGDASGPRDITTPGFQPTLGMWWDDLGDTGGMRTTDMPTDSWIDFGTVGLLTDRVLAIISTGFTVSFRNEVNGTGRNYYCVAIKDAANLFDTFTYAGDASDDRSVGSLGFTPEFALTNGNTNAAALRFKDESGDNSFLATASGEASDRIQAFVSGGIQVGTSANVNANSTTYYAWAAKDTAAAGTAVKDIIGMGFIPFAR